MDYMNIFFEQIINTAYWVFNSIVFNVPWYENYFWGLILISVLVWLAEIAFPWRKKQSIIRQDFWLDAFYMFFNFFVFAVVISGVYGCLELLFSRMGISASSLALFDIRDWPAYSQLLVFFIVQDFFQWFTHVLLHRFEWLWRFHKVHHSVKEMGFAAHLRYHWMENVLYKPLKVLAVMLIGGFEPEQAFLVHFLAITIGHLNHANLKLTYGPLKYVFNNPVMHLYHHASELPSGRYGVNYGISLSVWDYIFRTNYIPKADPYEPLGYSDDYKMPKSFFRQLTYGFRKSD